MKKIISIFLLLLGIIVFAGAQEIVEEIVAVVNNEIITRTEYQRQLQAIYQVLRAQLQGEEFQVQYEKAKANLLEMMIQEMLLLQAAREKGLNVTEQVNLNIENIKKEYGFESDEQLRRELSRQGMTMEEWRKQWEESLLKQALVYTEVDSKIVLDDAEIVNYYKAHPDDFTQPEEYRLRAIFLSSAGKTHDELEARKREIVELLQNGRDMGELAAQYSEGPEKESQGDLGVFKEGELSKSLENEIIKLKDGEFSPWIDIQTGWYLLKLEEKTERRLKLFEEARGDIEQKLFMEKKTKKEGVFHQELREKSYVKVLNPNPVDR